MFTGLVQGLGRVEAIAPGGVTELWVSTPFPASDFVHGESIACDGVCLTAIEFKGQQFRAQVAPETVRRSTAATWKVGQGLNLEKAMKVGDRLGGHWVQGHVDGVAQVLETRADGGSWKVSCSLPDSLAPFFVEKGSVCIDGVSLTVTHVDARSFSVMLIPETMQRTMLGTRRVGDSVNLEADIVGKYVARMMGGRGGLTVEQLKAAGLA